MISINGWNPGTQDPSDTPEPFYERDAQRFHEATLRFNPSGGPAPRDESQSFTPPQFFTLPQSFTPAYLRPNYPGNGSPPPAYLKPPPYPQLTSATPNPGRDEMALYQKVSQEVNAGADRQTIQGDAARLAIAARANGDIGLERDARNLGNSLGDGSYNQASTSKELAINAPGTIGARQIPEFAGSNASALGLAFSQLEKDVAGNTSFVGADADLVESLAKQSGEFGLADAVNNIKKSLKDGSYNQFDSLEALMQHPAKSSDMLGSTPSTPSPGTASPGTASPGTASPGTASPGTNDASGLSALVGPDKARVISALLGPDKDRSVADFLKAVSHQ